MRLIRRTLLATALLAITGLAAAADQVPTGPLPRTVVPTLVHLQLKLDPKQARFSGTTRIEARVAEATDTIWMHGSDLSIGKAEAVLADGRRIALKPEEADVSGVLKLSAAEQVPAGDVVIEIAYEAPFGQLQGAYRVKPDGHDYVITQMEPLGARHAFPGFDEPSFKQPWDITLIVPQEDVAVANTAETKTETLGNGWKKVSFKRTEALPSYLVAFAVGPWDVPQGPDIAPNGSRTTPIRLRGIAAQGQGGRMKYSLANTPAIVIALEDYFGIPYPFDKLDNVAAPDFWAGAMENAGLIVYRDSLMFPDENSAVGASPGVLGRQRARTRAPVVRRSRHHALVGRHLAQRRLRHLDGQQDPRPAAAGSAYRPRPARRRHRRDARRQPGQHAPHPRADQGFHRHPVRVRRHHLPEGRGDAGDVRELHRARTNSATACAATSRRMPAATPPAPT